MAIARLAPAKINLSLHLKGQRSDGYHLLDSLVAFAGIGDRISVERSAGLSLSLNGPFAGGLSTGADNLVLRAAERLAAGHPLGAAVHLEKNLPLASGIGGGSADAAATLAVLSELWGMPVPTALPAQLGADVPVCCAGPQPHRMRGIGDELSSVPDLPPAWVVLVNPLVGVATAKIFASVVDKNPPPAPPIPAEGFSDFDDFCGWLSTQRNDLQAAAIANCPIIAEVLAALGQAPLARMSGSGATCFGLLRDQNSAITLADQMRSERPDWWVAAAPVLD